MDKDKNEISWFSHLTALFGPPVSVIFKLLFQKSKHYPQIKIVGYLLDVVVIALAIYMVFFNE